MRDCSFFLVHLIAPTISDVATSRLLVLFGRPVMPVRGMKGRTTRLHELGRDEAIRRVDEESLGLGAKWIGIIATWLLIRVGNQRPYAHKLASERRAL